MIYTNDEGDRRERARNYILYVYILPATLAIVTGLLGYIAFREHYFDSGETWIILSFTVTPAVMLYAYNKSSWLKMPDGTHHYVKGIPAAPRRSLPEPAVYEAGYYYSKGDQYTQIILSILSIAGGGYLWLRKHRLSLVIALLLGGAAILYFGIKRLLDKDAVLKIATTGLWTRKLGFVHWDDMNYADVVEEKDGDKTSCFLAIHLKGTKWEESGTPDEKLLISNLGNTGA